MSRSLSAFNSQLPALIAAVFLLPAAPGGHARLRQHTSSCSSASLLLKADEQPGAPQLSPRSGSFSIRFLPAFKASADGHRQPNTFAKKKTRSVFPEIPLIRSLPMLTDPSSIALHLFCRLPHQGRGEQPVRKQEIHLKSEYQQFAVEHRLAQTIQHVDRGNTHTHSRTQGSMSELS